MYASSPHPLDALSLNARPAAAYSSSPCGSLSCAWANQRALSYAATASASKEDASKAAARRAKPFAQVGIIATTVLASASASCHKALR